LVENEKGELVPSNPDDKKVWRHYYPSRRYTLWPNFPPIGRVTLRIESWEKNNPEPIRPFYGSVDENGRFVDSQLTVTGSEWTAWKREGTAIDVGMRVSEAEARQKELEAAMRNLPNKTILYGGLGLVALLCIIGLVFLFKNSSVLSGIAPYFGITP
jgi:hypothetical protein